MKYEDALQEHKNLLCGHHMSPRLIRDVVCFPQNYWRRVVISKKSGKPRVCYSPHPDLRLLQSRVMKFVRKKIYNNWHRHPDYMKMRREYYGVGALSLSKGCGPLDSIVRNAEYHQDNQSSLVLDLKDAFASIKTKHVYRFLRHFIPDNLAWTFSRVLTFEGRIRQGAPISQKLFDFLMERFDRAIADAINAPYGFERDQTVYIIGGPPKLERMIYTRYGDDLCFSCPSPQFPHEVEEKVRRLVVQFGMRLNRKRLVGKERFLPLPGVQIVHGRIQPARDIIERMAGAIGEGDLWVTAGYRNFLHQFPRRGRKKAYKIAEKIAVSG